MSNLTENELRHLIEKVFAPTPEDRQLTLLLDIPNDRVPDNPEWQDRRRIASEWLELLQHLKPALGLTSVEVIYFENVGSNNADLPETVYRWPGDPGGADLSEIAAEGAATSLQAVLAEADIILALTEFSPTAPLRVFARRYRFRAGSMPGFNRKAIPALRIDYERVHEKVMKIKSRLDSATGMDIKFDYSGRQFEFFVDIRYREAHASSAQLQKRGVAGNLPSGEAFIVPYEGERGEESQTHGLLPVQFGEEVVIYRVSGNRAVEVVSEGEVSEREKQALKTEPAYGNIGEIGFGVLKSFGIKPIGLMLLDEKLGLHIAFGRSDHFGGRTSPKDFNDPGRVVHTDRVYIPDVQPEVKVVEVTLSYPDGRQETIIRDWEYML